MFADSLCKERERGRQGLDIRPRSLLAPLCAPAMPGLCLPVASSVGDSLLWPPWSPNAGLTEQTHQKEPISGRLQCTGYQFPSPSAPPKFQHLQKVAGLSCGRGCCHSNIVWAPGSAGKLRLSFILPVTAQGSGACL